MAQELADGGAPHRRDGTHRAHCCECVGDIFVVRITLVAMVMVSSYLRSTVFPVSLRTRPPFARIRDGSLLPERMEAMQDGGASCITIAERSGESGELESTREVAVWLRCSLRQRSDTKTIMSETYDISIEIDGERFRGAWSNLMGEMVVYYRGFTASTYPVPEEPDTMAKEMLASLVREHDVDLDALPNSIPEAIRVAAHEFMNADMDEECEAIEDLVHAFGESPIDSLPHQQLAWMCVNALSMIVPSWKHMCDDDVAEPAHAKLVQKLLDADIQIDLSSMSTPLIAKRNGIPVADCDECRLRPTAEAIAKTAAFMQTGESNAAIDALSSAYDAYEEGCHIDEAPERFSEWLALEVLQPSLECKPIKDVV